eukprot:4174145-Alexandrium_andersonii.AAC.1
MRRGCRLSRGQSGHSHGPSQGRATVASGMGAAAPLARPNTRTTLGPTLQATAFRRPGDHP